MDPNPGTSRYLCRGGRAAGGLYVVKTDDAAEWYQAKENATHKWLRSTFFVLALPGLAWTAFWGWLLWIIARYWWVMLILGGAFFFTYAMTDEFFGRMKNEMYYGKVWQTTKELEEAIARYIEFYNNHRIKTSLGGVSITAYRKLHVA